MKWIKRFAQKIRDWLFSQKDASDQVPQAVPVPSPQSLPLNTLPADVAWYTFRDEDGRSLRFAVRNRADHWGDPGTGAGVLTLATGEARPLNVNELIRKASTNKSGVCRTLPQQGEPLKWNAGGKWVVMCANGYMPEVEISVDGARLMSRIVSCDVEVESWL